MTETIRMVQGRGKHFVNVESTALFNTKQEEVRLRRERMRPLPKGRGKQGLEPGNVLEVVLIVH